MEPEHLAQRALAHRIAAGTTVTERDALLEWAQQLLAISRSSAGALAKTRQAFGATLTREVAWPVSKLLAAEIQRLAWTDRGLKSRWALSAAGAAAVAFGTQGAGIAALGGAVGVPLWLVFGAGGAFLGMLYEELQAKIGSTSPPQSASVQAANVIDVTATVVASTPVALDAAPASGPQVPITPGPDGRLNVGDTIRCVTCGNERVVSKAWLDALFRKREVGESAGMPLTASSALSKLRCSVCSAKSFTVQPGASLDSGSAILHEAAVGTLTEWDLQDSGHQCGSSTGMGLTAGPRP